MENIIDSFPGSPDEYIRRLERDNRDKRGQIEKLNIKLHLSVFAVSEEQHRPNRQIQRCSKFLKSIPPAAEWIERRTEAGIKTAAQVHWLVTFLVDFRSSDTDWEPLQTSQPAKSATNEIERARRYINRAIRHPTNEKLMDTAVRTRKLLFLHWCFLMKCERSANTDGLMREQFGAGRRTLWKHQRGVKWISSLSSDLCNFGWGHRAFELFALRECSER